MATKARINTLSRIRRRNAKLDISEQIKIDKELTTFELKRIESTLNAKIQLSTIGVDTSNFGLISGSQANKIKSVVRALKLKEKGKEFAFDNKLSLERTVNSLIKSNKNKIENVKGELSGLSGFGNIDFISESLTTVKSESALIEDDTIFSINAIFNKEFVNDTIKELTFKTNKALELQGLPTIIYDEFDIEDTIKKLNEIDQRTKNIARYVEFDEDINYRDFSIK